MKYWGYFLAKLLGAAALLQGLWAAMHELLPPPAPFMYVVPRTRFAHDLPYTAAVMAFGLLAAGLIYLIALDQRYRCRTCVRRLRMPVETGSWSHLLLLRPPRMEYICPFGHGTLDVPETPDQGQPHWQPHGDIWEELASLDKAKK